MIKMGLLSFSDGRERVHRDLVPEIEKNIARIAQFLREQEGIEVVKGEKIIYTPALAREEAQRLVAKGVDGVIFNIPVFAFPNFSVIAAKISNRPILIYSPSNGRLPGLGGLLAAAGSLKQMGTKCDKVWGDLDQERVRERLLVFTRAANAVSKLRGQVYGLIGGRSIGMNTGTIDTSQWARQFSVDVVHVDQLEIIRLADQIKDEEVEDALGWLQDNVKKIEYDKEVLTPETLKYQLKCYLATKRIIRERGMDFVGVKCHYELSEYYVTQCLSCAFFNDPYDWNGAKPPTVFACEADSDGALTMQLLKLVSGSPTLLFDFRHYDDKDGVYVFCNCGAMATWFAARSKNPTENLRKVTLLPTIPKYKAGGAHLQFVCQGGEVTFARLARNNGQYEMILFKGELVEFPIEKLRETCWQWPHAFARIDIPAEQLIDLYDSNHCHIVYGDYTREMVKVCEMLDIKPRLIG